MMATPRPGSVPIAINARATWRTCLWYSSHVIVRHVPLRFTHSAGPGPRERTVRSKTSMTRSLAALPIAVSIEPSAFLLSGRARRKTPRPRPGHSAVRRTDFSRVGTPGAARTPMEHRWRDSEPPEVRAHRSTPHVELGFRHWHRGQVGARDPRAVPGKGLLVPLSLRHSNAGA